MTRTSSGSTAKKLGLLQRVSLASFKHARTTAIIWLLVATLGVACYTTFLKREGFPSVNTPFAIATGSYIVHDPAKVDAQVAQPLNAYLLRQDGVKSVQTQSFDNFYTAAISYNEDVDAKVRTQQISEKLSKENVLPTQATVNINPFEFGFTQRGDDMVVSFYSKQNNVASAELVAQAKRAAAFLQAQQLSLVESVSIIDQFEQAQNPLTGVIESNQKSFDRYGVRQNDQTAFYRSVVIGVQAKKGADNLKLDAQVRDAVTKLNAEAGFGDYRADVSASYAPQIREQVSELQKSLIEGLIAVLIVGSIVIAVRASFITVLSMVSVIAIVNGLLYLFGYSLNTITLFALILGLSLIVDDTIIMVEALDAQRRRQKDPQKAVTEATRKVSRAMIAATSTAILSFAPLLFVGGILGSFIRQIPMTIISALAISLIVALVFIPFFARYLLLGKKQMGADNVHEASANFEAAIARFVSAPMLWAKGSIKKLTMVGLVAVCIGLGFIGAGGYLFSKVTFNIFPPSKDSNQLSATVTFAPGTSIAQAQDIANSVDQKIEKRLGDNFVRASYYGQADPQTATLVIDLIDYNDRSVRAPEFIEQLNSDFVSFKGASVKLAQLDAGPPATDFTVQVISGTNRAAAEKLANDVASYVKNDAKLERPDGTLVKIDTVTVGNSSVYTRKDKQQYIAVTVKFADTDTSTMVTLAKDAVEKKFNGDVLSSYGLGKDALVFSAGQEDENQDSFKTLALAFPILLGVIYVLLAFQFRSMLQPLLIFTALPFSLFGITLGLYLTDNAFSFFAMLGFFALIGLSIKNTILLTDFANQARKAGAHPVDAAHEALAERFRPLIATSLTAVFSLIPLAISSPFWEGLAVVLIFGLLSSTFLVVTVFPYYYLGAEFLRRHINRRTGLGWLVLTIALAVLYAKTVPATIPFAPFMAAFLIFVGKRIYRRLRS